MRYNEFLNTRATKMRDEILSRGLSLLKIGNVYHITGKGVDIRTTDLSAITYTELAPCSRTFER